MDNHEMERREYRRKRRIRNQILVYLTMIVVIAIVSLGIIFAVRSNAEKEQAESLVQSSQQEIIEEIVSSEPEIEKPTPTPEPTPTPDELLDDFIDEIVGQMPIEDRIAGLFFVTPESITGVGTAGC